MKHQKAIFAFVRWLAANFLEVYLSAGAFGLYDRGDTETAQKLFRWRHQRLRSRDDG